MKCKSSAFQQLHLLSLCSRQQTGEAPDAHESLHEKCPPVWDKWFHTNAEWQSVGRKWHTVGEKRERPAGDTWGERQNKSTRVRQRENKRKCGGDSLSVIHSHSREWLQGGMREYDSFFSFIPLISEKGSLYKAKELILAPSLFSFRSCGQCLRVCVHMCVRVWGRAWKCVCLHFHMASMQDGVNFSTHPYGKVLLLGAIAAASAFVVTILIVVLCVGCQRWVAHTNTYAHI